MEEPERRVMVYGDGEKVIVPFACIDDGGLASCDDPRGKRFELLDARGLRATIEVDERAGFEYRPAWGKGSQYRGLIWVEGFTADGLHSEGAVDLAGGEVRSLSYVNARFIWRDNPHVHAVCTPEELALQGDIVVTAQGERNEEAFHAFPRWQEFFEWEGMRASAPQGAPRCGEGGAADGIQGR